MGSPPEDAFARSMTRLRKAQGISIRQLATESGVSPKNIQGLGTRTRRGCLMHTAWLIAQALGTTVDAMITEADLEGVPGGQ